MTDPNYSWFWQPPMDGKPGLMMIVDNHPGPNRPEVPLVLEGIREVLAEVEAQIPNDVHLAALQIFHRDPTGRWHQIIVNPINRTFMTSRPDAQQGALEELWESRL